MREFEIKSKLKNSPELLRFLNSLEYKGKKRVIDLYLDTPNSFFFELGVFIRIRDNKKLDIKYNSNLLDVSHLSCDEYNFQLPLSNENKNYISEFLSEFSKPTSNTGALFEDFNLSEFITIDKQRKVYDNEKMEVVIDKVQNLGDFIEIEAKNEASSEVMKTAKALKLSNVPVGYVELYLRKNDFETYIKGRYTLEIDREE